MILSNIEKYYNELEISKTDFAIICERFTSFKPETTRASLYYLRRLPNTSKEIRSNYRGIGR